MRRRQHGNWAEKPNYGERTGRHVTMLLENNPYPQDVRVREEAHSLTGAGYTVEVIAPRAPGQPARECIDGVRVRRFRPPSPAGPGIGPLLLEYTVAFCALHRAALSALWRGDDVLHLHNPPDFLFPAGVLFRLARRKVVFDHHDLGPELVGVKFGSPVLVALARLAERLTFAVANHVLAANASHAELACTRGGKSSSEVTVVRNGPPRSWTQRPGGRRDGVLRPVRLVYVGAISVQDGADSLPEVIAKLRQFEPPVAATLTVVGDGDGRHQVEAAALRLGVADAVSITGWIDRELVPGIVEEGDICVDPAQSTRLNEHSTMIKLAEYLALGKPVVAYDLLETRRTVADAAVLVTSGDTTAFAREIAALAADEQRRAELARCARERGRELTWEHSEGALLAAYAALCPPVIAQIAPERPVMSAEEASGMSAAVSP